MFKNAWLIIVLLAVLALAATALVVVDNISEILADVMNGGWIDYYDAPWLWEVETFVKSLVN